MDFTVVVIILAIISLVLAVRSFMKQRKIEEVKFVKRELLRRKIVYHKDSSSSKR